MRKSNSILHLKAIRGLELLLIILNVPFIYAIIRNTIVNGFGIMTWLPTHKLLGIISIFISAPVIIMSGLAFIYAFKKRKLGLSLIVFGVVWIAIILLAAYIKTH